MTKEFEELRNNVAGQIYANLTSKYLAGELSILKFMTMVEETDLNQTFGAIAVRHSIRCADRFIAALNQESAPSISQSINQ